MRRRALLNPLELCITAIKTLLRQPLERYGEVMFNRGVRYERERMERIASTNPPPDNPAITEERELDLDKTQVGHHRRRDDTTPTRPVRPMDARALIDLEKRAAERARHPHSAEDVVVPPATRDPRSK